MKDKNKEKQKAIMEFVTSLLLIPFIPLILILRLLNED